MTDRCYTLFQGKDKKISVTGKRFFAQNVQENLLSSCEIDTFALPLSWKKRNTLMKLSSRQRHSAILLLMLLMLQMGAKVLHQHSHAQMPVVECDDCRHHRAHNAHMTIYEGGQSDCLLCQVIATPYLMGEVTRLDPYYICRQALVFESLPTVPAPCRSSIQLRAPPALL